MSTGMSTSPRFSLKERSGARGAAQIQHRATPSSSDLSSSGCTEQIGAADVLARKQAMQRTNIAHRLGGLVLACLEALLRRECQGPKQFNGNRCGGALGQSMPR